MMNSMKKIFNTREFELSHNEKPRGRGSWAFCDSQITNCNNYLDHVVFTPGGMTFAEAKKWISVHPKLWDVSELDVLP